MAVPLTADQQLAAVKRFAEPAGIKVFEYPGWKTRGIWRSKRDGFDVRGCTIHQTAGNLGRRTVEEYIRDIIVSEGTAVPDKSQVVIAPNGDIWMVGAGRMNHCLYYSDAALSAVTNASFSLSGNQNLRGSKTSFNRYVYGVECIGVGVLPEVQRKSAIVWAAAMSDAHKWTGQETHGHGEVAFDRGFADPGWNMGQFRKDVMSLVRRGPQDERSWFDMATKQDLIDALNEVLWTPVVDPKTNKSAEKHAVGSSWRNNVWAIHTKLDRLQATNAGLKAGIEALAKGLGNDPEAIGKAVEEAMTRALNSVEVKFSIDKE